MIPARVLNWRPRGLSDAVDGTNAFPGAMALLANLIPDPATRDVMVCRPAQTDQVNLRALSNAGFISCYFIVGDIVYGLIATDRNPGHDEPFAFTLPAATFLPVSGVTASNVPLSPPSTGEWTPPIMDQIAHRVLVCHPGFPGGAVKFGWFDISSFSETTTATLETSVTTIGDTDTTDQPYINGLPVTQNTVSQGVSKTGDPLISTMPGFNYPNNGNPAPFIPGAPITGTGIPANTTILAAELTQVGFTCNSTSGNPTLTNIQIKGVSTTAGLYVGQIVVGEGVPQSVILSINRGAHSMVVSNNATASVTGTVLVSYGTRLKLSNNVTATNDNVTFTIQSNSIITGQPEVFGVQPGMTVTGAGIPAGATVVSTLMLSTSFVCALATGSTLVTALDITKFGSVAPQMSVTGNGIPAGTSVTAVDPTTFTITLSAAALATISSELFFDGASIQLSAPITTPATDVSITIAGGTPTNPLWGAGDTNLNNLPSKPVAVAQFNSRAYFACGVDGIPFSDAGFPCQISNNVSSANLPPGSGNVQALLPGNGLPVTCFGKLQLSTIAAGGVVQGLVAFQRDAAMLQITGDPTIGNFAMNALPVGTGTHAPLSVFSCQIGVGFISPLGLRFVDFGGNVTAPVGYRGDGVSMPFVLANNPPLGGPIDPSRICAASNGNTCRITVPTNSGISYEYWYHISDKVWTGPHTCPASLIQVWSDTYLVAPVGVNAVLRRSDDVPTLTSVYVEGGAQLSWGASPVLLPDNQEGVMNAIIESTVALQMPTLPTAVSVSFVDEGGQVLDQVYVVGTEDQPGWGGFSWNGQLWGAQGPAFQQLGIPWSEPIIFKQGRVVLNGTSGPQVRVGNLYLKIRPLTYQNAAPEGWIDALYGTAGIILTDDDGKPITGGRTY